jgi:hypothetical protein
MRYSTIWLLTLCIAAPLSAQQGPDGPHDEKAQKTYKEAFELLKEHRIDSALDRFKKASKQDGGHCRAQGNRMKVYARPRSSAL